MSDYKDFTGKTIDEAIELACKHFNASRNKLEIEILTGGSTGIFGLVGVKKASIRARLRHLETAPLHDSEAGAREDGPKRQDKPEEGREKAAAEAREEGPREKARPESEEKREQPGKPRDQRQARPERPKQRPPRQPEAREEAKTPSAQAQPEEQKQAQQKPSGRRRGGRRRPRQGREAAPADSAPVNREKPAPKPESAQPAPQAAPQPAPQAAPEEPKNELSPYESKELVLEIVRKLIEPILPDAKLTAEAEAGRVKVRIEENEDIGLIIGAEGQTISALQYLANRVVARKVNADLRVHLDAGEYREKQDDSLRQLAWSLAEKAKDQGKAQATRPLSSYHRRVVHLALQEDDSIQTRSKGEGPLKRVLILPRRGRPNNH